jgi:three-Cys-motif partner protein
MAVKSIFDKPFDDGTKVKLSVFESYLEKWLPVFVSRQEIIWQNIQIFDFFSGMGKDENGELGSPLRTIKIVNSYCSYIKSKNLKIRLVFNELDPDYFQALQAHLSEIKKACYYEIVLANKPFNVLFDEEYPQMTNSANFIFLDQNGIKEITHSVFKKIIALKQTDFLFFISSSFFKRFANTPEFKSYFPFDPTDIANTDYYHIHRKVLLHYKSIIPRTTRYFLAPFSIKKNSNIYGLVFGTPHTLGIEKFLSVAWKIDPITGEANYDIDNENISISKPFLFEEMNKPTKRQVFEVELEKNILNKTYKNNWDVYFSTLEEGFLLKDANTVLIKMKTAKKIDFDFKLISENLHKCSSPEPIKIL